jgi:hypothetical protein
MILETFTENGRTKLRIIEGETERVYDITNHIKAKVEYATRELVEVLEELADIVDGFIAGEREPDSFTTQPARSALAKAKGV